MAKRRVGCAHSEEMLQGCRLIALGLLAVCWDGGQMGPANRYDRASRLQREGLVEQALTLARTGLGQYSPASSWYWKFRLLTAETLLEDRLRQGAEEEALKLLTKPPGWDRAPLDTQARAKAVQAFIEHQKRKPQDARVLLDQAESLGRQAGSSSLLPLIELRRGMLEQEPSRAAARYRAAAVQAQRLGDLAVVARAYGALGYDLFVQARYDEAVQWFELSAAAAGRVSANRTLERVLGNLGWCYYNLGQAEPALELFSRAEALAAEIGDDNYVYRWMNDAGYIHFEQGGFQRATRCFNGALAAARKARDELWQAMVLNNLAEVNLARGDLETAAQLSDEASLIKRTRNLRGSLPYSLWTSAQIDQARGRLKTAGNSYREAIQIAREVGDSRAMWEAHAGLASLHRAAQRRLEADAEYRNALLTIEEKRAALSQFEFRVTFLSRLMRFYRDYVDYLLGQNRWRRALEVADASRARVLKEKLGNGWGLSDRLDLERLRAVSRRTSTVLLFYWVGPRRIHLWVISPRGEANLPLTEVREIERLTEWYSQVIREGQDPLESLHPAGRRLFEELVEPVQAYIPAGTPVLIVPDGPLYGLNFETLVVERPRPHYWIEDVTVTIVPSLGVLERSSPDRAGSPRLLFIGNPESPDSHFPPLRYLSEEETVVTEKFLDPDRAVYTSRRAKPEVYREARLQDFGFIHFAAHAVPNRESPLSSAVILSEGKDGYKLYARDIEERRLHCELVTLSACHSAGSRAYSGEGLLGFSWAFLRAGAQLVIAGLWDVDDRAAPGLMGRLYTELAKGVAPQEALRQAKLGLLHSASAFRKPYYWGSFQVFTRRVAGKPGRAGQQKQIEQ